MDHARIAPSQRKESRVAFEKSGAYGKLTGRRADLTELICQILRASAGPPGCRNLQRALRRIDNKNAAGPSDPLWGDLIAYQIRDNAIN